MEPSLSCWDSVLPPPFPLWRGWEREGAKARGKKKKKERERSSKEEEEAQSTSGTRARLDAAVVEDSLDLGGDTTGLRGVLDSRGAVVEADNDGLVLGAEGRDTLVTALELGELVVAAESKILLASEGVGRRVEESGVAELLDDVHALSGSHLIALAGSKEGTVGGNERATGEAVASDLRKPSVPARHVV